MRTAQMCRLRASLPSAAARAFHHLPSARAPVTSAPFATQAGAVVVDNSSAFRMEPEVPLVVPEINGADIRTNRGIIANPNCTTAITLMALWPLHREFGVTRVWASSYQAVSGTGAQAIEELRQQVQAIAQGRPVVKSVYPHQI